MSRASQMLGNAIENTELSGRSTEPIGSLSKAQIGRRQAFAPIFGGGAIAMKKPYSLLSPADALTIKPLSEKVDRVIEGDRRFFRRRPDRSHRLRLASAVEVEIMDRLRLPTAAPGLRSYVAVRKIANGVRVRAFLSAPAGFETDVNESTAAFVFEKAANKPLVSAIEARWQRQGPAR